MMNVQKTCNRLHIEESEDWKGWVKKIPALKFPERWSVQIIPPYRGMMCRFRVWEGEVREWNYVSVFLDCSDPDSFFDGPYWEVYGGDECEQCAMDDTETLMRLIKEALEGRAA